MEKWFIKNKKADFALIAKSFGISETLAHLAVNRGITSGEALKSFLAPSLSTLASPKLFKDGEKLASTIVEKLSEGKRVRIIGDYDVDGVMSTYLLYRGLTSCAEALGSASVIDYEIPDRIKDGYGINIDLVEVAWENGVDTIITCDNGIAAKSQVAYGKEKGMTMLITDHHDIPIEEGVPAADAVVNPKQEDCTYPFPGLCGAGVVFQLLRLLFEACGIPIEKWEELVEFTAIATVCDVMDLVEENRAIVSVGLKRLEHTKNIGLKALILECGLEGSELTAYHMGFVIGPCINATGRLDTAKKGLSLLMTEDEKEAARLAKELRTLNEERKVLTEEGLKAAVSQVENSPFLQQDKVLVIYLADCHESLAGIIAGRLRERYNKPTIVLTKTEKGVKGSGRSIEEYSMFEELSRCGELLTKFGGHPMAAGLSLEEEKIEKLRQTLNEKTTLTEDDLIPKLSFDMVLPFRKISLSLIREMALLEPYGKGNPKPRFALKDVELKRAFVIGKNKNMLRLQVKQADSPMYTAMLFSGFEVFQTMLAEKYGALAFDNLLSGRAEGYQMDILFYPDINEYNGYENIQLVVESFR
ncbi:single-stranded-DNA-specific exonuclease RecJ [Acetivibrio ethanolgignens]|uniref:Single-stranded-DNA-specific exonuclease RecJ n=1 Tax=Acetivibrio ethanolgignens TaxID=290052 RepID=A0A0V8QBQ9_9FIRM|nr:single-stranded-DNA-specific exonuclease RecJ [Acetivibrio ethanolgignens]KSV58027.1 single-stranded-DNA-specific exonuclease RecJ [Acetivibrio ethanolgignens]